MTYREIVTTVISAIFLKGKSEEIISRSCPHHFFDDACDECKDKSYCGCCDVCWDREIEEVEKT